ncbi:MAG: hypothetical protein FJZ01_16645 [Candidatus Sericytochromatia bacterium]|nr:hypothetical protein [Candidatus Tanganyikabacteria bacterium]
MKLGDSLRMLLAVTVAATMTGCDLGPAASKVKKAGSKLAQTFLDQAGGSEKEQAGRSIIKDSIAVLQADLEGEIGSSLADDASFGTQGAARYAVQGDPAPTLQQLEAQLAEVEAKIKALTQTSAGTNVAPSLTNEQKAQLAELESKRNALREAIAKAKAASTTTSGGSTGSGGTATSGGSNTTAGGSTGTSSEADRLRKELEEIYKAGQPLVEKMNSGQKLSAEEAAQLERLKKAHAEISAKLEALKKQQGGTTAPPPPKPEPPKVDPNKKPPEPPKEHIKPEEHFKAAPKPEQTASADVAALRKELEKLQKANEQLRKQQDELRKVTDELKKKLEEVAKKREEQEKKAKEVAKNVQKGFVDNGDGTLTYTMKMESETKKTKTTHEVSKTVNALTKEVIEESSFITKVLGNGATMKIGRTRKFNEDGSWSATSSSEITKDGKTKKVDWNKTVNADGSGSAEGKITRHDGSTVTITITRNADGSTTATAVDTGKKVKADVAKESDMDTTAEAKISDTATGQTIAEVTVEDPEGVPPTAE